VSRKLGNVDGSIAYYQDGLALAADLPGRRNPMVVACMVEGVGMLTIGRGEARDAVWLLSAGDALRASISVPRPPQEQADFERTVDRVRPALDPDTFDTMWSEARATSADHAVGRALKIIMSGELAGSSI
jgi:hypothetical protein